MPKELARLEANPVNVRPMAIGHMLPVFLFNAKRWPPENPHYYSYYNTLCRGSTKQITDQYTYNTNNIQIMWKQYNKKCSCNDLKHITLYYIINISDFGDRGKLPSIIKWSAAAGSQTCDLSITSPTTPCYPEPSNIGVHHNRTSFSSTSIWDNPNFNFPWA